MTNILVSSIVFGESDQNLNCSWSFWSLTKTLYIAPHNEIIRLAALYFLHSGRFQRQRVNVAPAVRWNKSFNLVCWKPWDECHSADTCGKASTKFFLFPEKYLSENYILEVIRYLHWDFYELLKKNFQNGSLFWLKPVGNGITFIYNLVWKVQFELVPFFYLHRVWKYFSIRSFFIHLGVFVESQLLPDYTSDLGDQRKHKLLLHQSWHVRKTVFIFCQMFDLKLFAVHQLSWYTRKLLNWKRNALFVGHIFCTMLLLSKTANYSFVFIDHLFKCDEKGLLLLCAHPRREWKL